MCSSSVLLHCARYHCNYSTYSIYNAGIILEKIARGVAMYPCFKMQSVNYGNESEAEQLSGGHNPSEEGGRGVRATFGGGGAKCPPCPPPKKNLQ